MRLRDMIARAAVCLVGGVRPGWADVAADWAGWDWFDVDGNEVPPHARPGADVAPGQRYDVPAHWRSPRPKASA